MYNVSFDAPIGMVQIGVEDELVRTVDFHWQATTAQVAGSLVLKLAQEALIQYFEAATPLQHIPHQPQGTPFQLRVWQALREIPLGSVMTYGELAKVLDSSPRAVGGACRSNPIPLIIPCHRVIAKGSVGGFLGQWGEGERVNVKQWLLQHEGVIL